MAYTPRKHQHNGLIEKELGFQSFVTQSSAITKELKSLILKRLNMAESTNIPTFEAKSIENSKTFKEAWDALNRQLRKILSLLKVLLCQQTSIQNEFKNIASRNQQRIIESCTAFNQANQLCDEILQHTSKYGLINNLFSHLGQNLYTYESSTPSFKTIMSKLSNNSIYNKKPQHKRNYTANFSVTRQIKHPTSSHKKQLSSSKYSTINRKEFPSRIQRINTVQYDNYVSQLQSEIVHLKQQIVDIQKDRQQLKQYNILLLQNQGILNDKRKSGSSPKRVIHTQSNYSNISRQKQEDRLKISQSNGGITGFCLKFNTLT